MKIIIYGHQYCNKCKEAKRIVQQLEKDKGIEWKYFDIIEDIEAKDFIDDEGIVELPYIIKSEQISLDQLRKL